MSFLYYIKSESGITTTEYGLILGVLALGTVASVNGVGISFDNFVSGLADRFESTGGVGSGRLSPALPEDESSLAGGREGLSSIETVSLPDSGGGKSGESPLDGFVERNPYEDSQFGDLLSPRVGRGSNYIGDYYVDIVNMAEVAACSIHSPGFDSFLTTVIGGWHGRDVYHDHVKIGREKYFDESISYSNKKGCGASSAKEWVMNLNASIWSDHDVLQRRVHTLPGREYQLSFAYRSASLTQGRSFEVYHGDLLVDTITPNLSGEWQTHSLTISGDGLSSISFRELLPLDADAPLKEADGPLLADFALVLAQGGGETNLYPPRGQETVRDEGKGTSATGGKGGK